MSDRTQPSLDYTPKEEKLERMQRICTDRHVLEQVGHPSTTEHLVLETSQTRGKWNVFLRDSLSLEMS